MKILKYNLAVIIICCISIANTALATSTDDYTEFTKEVDKIFDINEKGTVYIGNKYGNMNIKTWDKNKVEVHAVIKVDAKNQQQADEIFERIYVEFNHSSNHVSAQTIFEDSDKSWWSSLWSGGNNADHYEIHYEVTMPKTCMADLSNKYGNISIEDLAHHAKIWLKYGNLDGGDIQGNLELYLKYGNGKLLNIGDLQLDLGYGNFAAITCADAEITSKYSEITLVTAKNIIVQSKYDNYSLGTVKALEYTGKYDNYVVLNADKISIHTKHTDFEVHMLNESITMESKYGSASIHGTSPSFNLAIFDSSYTPIELITKANFSLDAELKYADANITDRINFHNKEIDDKYTKLIGDTGAIDDVAIIKADLRYGHLVIQDQ